MNKLFDGAGRFLRRSLFAAALLVITAGCGGKAGKPVSHLAGTLTIGGQPLPDDAEGSITFKPTERGQANTHFALLADGRYDAPAVPQGTVTVLFNVQQPTGRMIREGMGTPFPEKRNLVPEEFGKGMRLEVSGDNLDQDFKL